MDFTTEYTKNQNRLRELVAIFSGFIIALDEYKNNPYKNSALIETALKGAKDAKDEIVRLNDLNEELIKNL